MKQIGILFNAEMVRAILARRKTLTSRLRGLGKINAWPGDNWRYDGLNVHGDHLFTDIAGLVSGRDPQECIQAVKSPYGRAGDLLTGRETWRIDAVEPPPGQFTRRLRVRYRADNSKVWFDQVTWPNASMLDPKRWTPSIHMPFWASRLRLPVFGVWPSRLQDMTEEMAIQEGVNNCMPFYWRKDEWQQRTPNLARYAAWWDLINRDKPGCGWADNPWVWRIHFSYQKT